MNNKIVYFYTAIALLAGVFLGCATDTQDMTRNYSEYSQEKIITPPQEKKLVAIAGFENKSTYASDKLWDTSSQLLTSNLIQIGYFRVVEWERMKQLFDWDALGTSSIVKSPEKRSEARKILLCEYFLTGAVTFFDVKQSAKVSAISKRKIIETTIRVDLMLQDAFTGEYLGASTGEWTETQNFKGGLTGGRTGTWDPASADKALNNAIREALFKLVKNFSRNERNG